MVQQDQRVLKDQQVHQAPKVQQVQQALRALLVQ